MLCHILELGQVDGGPLVLPLQILGNVHIGLIEAGQFGLDAFEVTLDGGNTCSQDLEIGGGDIGAVNGSQLEGQGVVGCNLLQHVVLVRERILQGHDLHGGQPRELLQGVVEEFHFFEN